MMYNSTRYIKFYVLVLLISLQYVSFSQQYNFTKYSLVQGLVQSQAHVLFEDSRGYLWIGTDGGVSMFSGKEFVNYTIADGLSNNQIRAIFEDSKGNIWFGTKNGYACRFNGTGFTRYNKKHGLESHTVYAFAEDSAGIIYLGTEGKGLFKYQNNKFNRINLIGDTLYNSVKALYITRDGKVCVGSSNYGLFIIDNDNIVNLNKKDGLADNNINAISEDHSGNLWIATVNGVSKYDGKVFNNFYMSNGLCDDNITTVICDNSGYMWFGSFGSGACKTDGRNFLYFNENNGLCSNFIHHICQDRSENIWFSSESGICKFDSERFRHLTVQDGLPSNIIMSVYEDSGGNVWFGTYGGGVSKYYDGKFHTYSSADGLCGDIIYTICEDSKGNLWFGSKGSGLSILIKDDENTGNARFRNYDVSNNLPSDMVYSIIRDRYDNMWIGTLGGGICIYNGESFTNISENQGISSNNIYVLYEDSKGNIWIGTDNKGVDMLFARCTSNDLIKNKKIESTDIINITNTYGLSNDLILSIAEAKNGDIWFGTYGGGICKFDGKEIFSYSVEDGLNSNSVYFLLMDSRDFLWVGTEKGINRIPVGTKEDFSLIKTYGRDEGFRGIESNLNAAMEDSKGYLWFGTVNGVTIYDPSDDLPNDFEPQTNITDIKLFFESTDWSVFSDSLMNWTFLPYDLVLPYNQNHLSFEFIGIDLKTPQKVKYKWILEGFDRQWSPVSDKHEATYSYVPFGDYTFKVKACNGDGIWNKEPVSFSFSISPPFWLTWWFYVIMGIIFITVIISIIKVRERKLEIDKRILEEQVRIRTRELQKEKEVVEFQKKEISEQAEELEATNKELEKLSIVASETDNSVIIADAEGRIEWVNAGFTRLYGYTLEEFKREKGDNVFEVSTNKNIKEDLELCIHEKKSVIYTSPNTTKDNKEIWVQTTLTPILDSDNNLLKLVAIDSDITTIKEAEEEIKQQKQEITDSIEYASRIQTAILPPGDYLDDVLPCRFILFKPRDIVSGDFYWLKKKNNKIILVAADCTGHGVPGAFMSILGVTFLNEIVSKAKDIKASQILNELRDNVIQSLHQTGKWGEAHDGMDITLCIIDYNERTLEFSGAYNPVYLIRNKELIEIKGDKMPIGIHTSIKDSFTNHKYSLMEDDRIYMFSDGYIDQFGGPKGKKFKTNQFKEILLKIHEEPIDRQYEILNKTIEEWQGDMKQIDDILVMGIHLTNNQ